MLSPPSPPLVPFLHRFPHALAVALSPPFTFVFGETHLVLGDEHSVAITPVCSFAPHSDVLGRAGDVFFFLSFVMPPDCPAHLVPVAVAASLFVPFDPAK